MRLERIEGETLCQDCTKPACFQIITSRASATKNTMIVTGVLSLCNDCAGSMRYQLMIRQWDMHADGKYRPHGFGSRWWKFWDGVAPEKKDENKRSA